MKNPYEILDIPRTASEEEIKKAYKKAANKFHPDKEGGSEEKFKEIKGAYDQLTDPQNIPRGGPNINDIFNQHFNMGRGGFYQQNFQIHNTSVHVSLEDAFKGKTHKINLPNSNEMLDINVHPGVRNGESFQAQVQTQTGQLLILRIHFAVLPHSTFKVEDNNLTMSLTKEILDFYRGCSLTITGIDGKELAVKLPTNSKPGQVLRLKGQGFIHNGMRGDLYVTVNVELPNLNEEQLIKLEEVLCEFTK